MFQWTRLKPISFFCEPSYGYSVFSFSALLIWYLADPGPFFPSPQGDRAGSSTLQPIPCAMSLPKTLAPFSPSFSSLSAFLSATNATWTTLVVALVIPAFVYNRYATRRRRLKLVRELDERVLILGGSRSVSL